jgi:hypothetical protein
MGEITLSKELTQGTTQTDRSPNTNKAHGPHHNPITSTTRQTTILSRPRANLCLARRGGGTPRGKLPPRSRAHRPLSGSPPRSRASVPQANLRLARGSSPSSRSPPRLKLPLGPRHLTYSPDRSIKCPDTPRAPGSKGKSPPRRSPDAAWESGLDAVRTARRCAAITDIVRVLCVVAGIIP